MICAAINPSLALGPLTLGTRGKVTRVSLGFLEKVIFRGEQVSIPRVFRSGT